MQEKLQTLYAEILPRLFVTGKNPTPVSYISIYYHTQKKITLPDMTNPCLFLIANGTMKLHSTEGVFHYHPGQYLISAIDHPQFAEVVSDLQTNPLVALLIEFSVDDVVSVMLDLDGNLPEKLFDEASSDGMVPDTDEKLLDTLIRLMNMTKTELSFMEKHLKRELIFHLITGCYGRQFIQSVVKIGQAGDIYSVNSWIKQNYKLDFAIEDLAGQSNMSLSSFHQKFKNAVGMGPLQCQKKLRLTEARRLMLDQSTTVTDAAMEVGYESVSQFIRDYRRMFGRSPQKDIQELRKAIQTQKKSE